MVCRGLGRRGDNGVSLVVWGLLARRTVKLTQMPPAERVLIVLAAQRLLRVNAALRTLQVQAQAAQLAWYSPAQRGLVVRPEQRSD